MERFASFVFTFISLYSEYTQMGWVGGRALFNVLNACALQDQVWDKKKKKDEQYIAPILGERSKK